MRIRLRVLPALCSAGVLLASAAMADDVRLTNGVQGAAHIGVVSYREIPFKTVVRQQHDFSCGSAALATLLTYHFDRPTTEKDAFVAMYEMGDKEKINREGFSLFEMKQYLESLGYRADGFRVGLDKVERVGMPVIALIDWQSYKHFVVIKGLRNGRILLGDPARGTRAMPRSRFEELWDNKILFVIHNRREIAGFNLARDWRTAPPAPLDAGIARDSLYNIVTPRKRPGDI